MMTKSTADKKVHRKNSDEKTKNRVGKWKKVEIAETADMQRTTKGTIIIRKEILNLDAHNCYITLWFLLNFFGDIQLEFMRIILGKRLYNKNYCVVLEGDKNLSDEWLSQMLLNE